MQSRKITSTAMHTVKHLSAIATTFYDIAQILGLPLYGLLMLDPAIHSRFYKTAQILRLLWTFLTSLLRSTDPFSQQCTHSQCHLLRSTVRFLQQCTRSQANSVQSRTPPPAVHNCLCPRSTFPKHFPAFTCQYAVVPRPGVPTFGPSFQSSDMVS